MQQFATLPAETSRDGRLNVARDLAARFATRAAGHDMAGSFPHENIAELAEAGLLALTVPARFGGPGLGIGAVAEIVAIIATGDASTALVLLMHLLQSATLFRSDRWPPHLQARLATEALDGVALVNGLRVEPELGTPARGGLPATYAVRIPGGWRLNGRKIYSTGSPALRYGLVWTRTDDQPAPRVGMMLVPMDRPGVAIEPSWNHLGMRASGSHDVVFTDVEIPEEHAVDLRPPADWSTRDPVQGIWSNLGIAALYDGVARAARDWLGDYLHRRVPSNLGAPLASLPRMQEGMGRIEALLLANEALIQSALAAAEQDIDAVPTTRANLVKYSVTGNAIAAVADALELVGNPGLSRSNPLERHYRDVLCSRVHTPQNDTILQAAGRAALARRGGGS